MTTNYHTPIPTGAAANAETFNAPLGQIDESLSEALLLERDGHIIQHEGVDLAQQARLDFVGAGVSVANGIGKTTVTIPGTIVQSGNNKAQGRLTLESGVPVSSSNQLGKTTLYYTPYCGNVIDLSDDSGNWQSYKFSELSLPLAGLTANRNYDIFCHLNAGVPALEATAWINDATRTTSLILADGVLVRFTIYPTRRYLGTIRITDTTGQCEDSVLKRFVWNYYNRIERMLQVLGTSGHTYTTTTARYWNNDSAMKYEFVIGWQEDQLFATILNGMTCAATSSTTQGCIGLGINSTSALTAISFWANAITQRSSINTAYIPALGYNYIALLEIGLTGCTFSVAQSSMLLKG